VTISALKGGTVNSCPVCGYQGLRRPPRNFSICPSCGTEFEYDDFGMSREEVDQRRIELRNRWIESGPIWHSKVVPAPPAWNPVAQLLSAGFSLRLRDSGLITQRPGWGQYRRSITIQRADSVDMTEERRTAVLNA